MAEESGRKGRSVTDKRTEEYAGQLAKMVRMETVSVSGQRNREKFYRFHDLLRELFPRLFEVCEFEDFEGSILLRWKGREEDAPMMFMNHHDVVEAPGDWKYPAFSGTVAEGKLWGRGTLDTKGGLWAMLRAAEELAEEGFVPGRDLYFLSACTEECDGSGAEAISSELERRGIRFSLILDEGGMMLEEPIGGAKGTFAMVGVGEKGCADLKFIARSKGGHASTPGKNTPLVRLGKFMAAVERGGLFHSEISPVVRDLFGCLSGSMRGPLRFVLSHAKLFEPLLVRIMPLVSNSAAAMLRTTVAFTMAAGSDGANVLPQEAWVIGNMRYSHHQGGADSIRAIKVLAEKFDIETQVLDRGVDSALSDHTGPGFERIRNAVNRVFPEVTACPYVMTAASDSRYMGRISDCCLRFTPFLITDEQMSSIHGINENIDLAALAPAVDFYRYLMTDRL